MLVWQKRRDWVVMHGMSNSSTLCGQWGHRVDKLDIPGINCLRCVKIMSKGEWDD